MINKYIILVLSINALHESSGQSGAGDGSQGNWSTSLADILRRRPTGFDSPRPSDILADVSEVDMRDAAISSNLRMDSLDQINLVGVTDGFGEPGLIEPNHSVLSDPTQDGFGTLPENSANIAHGSIRSATTAGSLGPGSGKNRRRRRKRPRKQHKPRRESLRPVDTHIEASNGATHVNNIHNTLGNNPDSTIASVSVPMTDVHGNKPPSPEGVHIDLLGEHGNMNDFPVVHSDENLILPDVGMVDFNPGIPLEKPNTAGTVVNIPLEPFVPTEISLGTKVPVLSEVTSGDPMVTQSRNIFHASNVHNILPDTLPTGDKFVDLAAHGNSGFANSIHNDIPKTIESAPKIVNNGFDGTEISNVHVDLPGEHGNSINGIPLIHRDDPPFISPVASNTHKGTIGTTLGAPLGNVHVDMPGEHGNPIDGAPLIHRAEQPHFGSNSLDNGAIPSHLLGNVHVDMSGEHGNPIDGAPVIHRAEQPNFVSNSFHNGAIPGQSLGNVHVDMPGEHGNPIDGAPVIHRAEQPHFGSNSFHNGAIPGQSLGSVHVDMPGEHGNPIDGAPVIHRAEQPHFGSNSLDNGAVPGQSLGSVHVHMPGEHGNPIDGVPVIHRPEQPHLGSNSLDNGAIPGQQVNMHLGSVHIDMPGEHGNPIDGIPVVHRNEPSFVQNGPTNGVNFGTPLGIIHVDMPGEHGNPVNGAPVAHRNEHNVHGHNDHGIHIDAPGEHGNSMNEPALHLPPGATVEDARAAGVLPGGSIFPAGVIPQKTNVPFPAAGHGSTVHVDMSVQHNNPVGGLSLIHHGKAPNVGPDVGHHNSIHGIHIDAPGEHGNTLDEPALHLPPGATIADARAAGIIPNIPADGPFVPTGVLPGIADVPMPGKPGHNILVPHVSKHRPSLGENLGLPTVTLPVKPNTMSNFLPSLPIDDHTLLDYGRDTRGRGPWRGRRKGGRRWGRRRGRKGRRGGKGKWKNDFHDDHFHPETTSTTTTTTTTTTTPAPSKPGNGITIIRSSRPNPFGNLGNVLRSALTGGGSNGGGLFGSLLQTALGSMGGGGFRGFGPAPGPVMMIPGRRPMFGGIFQG